MKRKMIGCIIANPENNYAQIILRGLTEQCKKYGYHLLVFTVPANIATPAEEYMEAEKRIVNLINFDMLDGVVFVPIMFICNENMTYVNEIADLLKKKCRKPVVTIDKKVDKYPVFYNDEEGDFAAITDHVIDKHGCKDIYFLNGHPYSEAAYRRLQGVLMSFKKHGMDEEDLTVVNGDFWYTSGNDLANKLLNKKMPMPEAIICANDHMAVALTNTLTNGGVKIPEDLIVTGYDGTSDALFANVSITTYCPSGGKTAAQAIDYIRKIIEPEAELIPFVEDEDSNFVIGGSCGCHYDFDAYRKELSKHVYKVDRDNDSEYFDSPPDIGLLLESPAFEKLTSMNDPTGFMHGLSGTSYLLRPYTNMFLVLRTDWTDEPDTQTGDYPEKMRESIHVTSPDCVEYTAGKDYGSIRATHDFDTSLMLPELYLDWKSPYVFYFAPIHYSNNTLGYVVIQYTPDKNAIFTSMHRNWIKNVSSAVEINYIHNKLLQNSVYDGLTGLLNRNGMNDGIVDLIASSLPQYDCLCMVIDMDNLKITNDTYGHAEGDFALETIAKAINKNGGDNELLVRAGGDEFYIIGIGIYHETYGADKKRDILESLKELSDNSDKPYEISASIGFAMGKMEQVVDSAGIDHLIREADKDMYRCKVERKKQRQI